MHYYEVAPIRIVRAGSSFFTYSSAEVLKPGSLVFIEVGKKQMIGLVLREVKQPSYVTKSLGELIEQTSLPTPLIQLSEWLADYYMTPLATVLQTVLPRGLDKKRRAKAATLKPSVRNRTTIVLNKDQQAAVKQITDSSDGTFLLQGVTGSGKTEVYKEVTRQTLAAGKSVIVLIPEISLTTQVIDEFAHEFSDVVVTHSHMTEAERHLAWRQVLTAEKPLVIIGPRSALFMPATEIGAIIVDEAHEPSYKQEQAPRYSALRVATMLGRFHKAKVIFGSATPSVTERYLAEIHKRPILKLDTVATAKAQAPTVTLVDMTKRDNFKHHRFLSDALISNIEQNLTAKKQTLVFHNRRGSASTTLCENCGWTAQCPRCFIPLTLHTDTYQLTCHVCDHKEKVPTHCPVCAGANIIHKGIGTKLIESELRKLFPKATIARFDSDNTSDETVDQLYEKLYNGSIDIAIGTQVVAKGLDLPHLRTVGVIQADSGLALPDYIASERAFQLLSQVVGRVGRNEHATTVVVQTYQPTHPVISYGLHQDYESFYSYALEQRKSGHFPPFTYLLRLTTIYKTESAAIRSAQSLARELKQKAHSDVRIFGPTPAFYERTRDTYRWQLVLKSPKREHLIDALQYVPPTHWQADLDPASLL